ncbi:hypothetical protein GZH53_14170 [Flavihumibacter sp. R14]|nr:hypothetical protein [Flavihumibacter soli]
MKRSSLIVAFLLFCFPAVHAQTPTFITDSLNNYIQTGIKDWEIPGLEYDTYVFVKQQ